MQSEILVIFLLLHVDHFDSASDTMDQKTWLWRKKSAERSIIATDNIDLSSKRDEEEVRMLLTDKTELQKDIKDLNDKLSIALNECSAKDDLIKEHEKVAQEAIARCKKAEAGVASVKQELDSALWQKEDCEDRVAQLDAALKECMQQLRFVREDQERRIQDAAIKISTEFNESQGALEDKLAETSKRLDKVATDNTGLTKALLAKEALVKSLNTQKFQVEADVSELMSRLESMEKENGSLNYNVRVLEKELEIRNEEREFNCRAAEASHRHHLENVKKIAKLESECQRLRHLVRKRLPGPAALAKMKNEVEMLGRNSIDMRRKKLNSNLTSLSPDLSVDRAPDAARKIDFLNQQLCSLEEENKSLKLALNKKISELQVSRIMCAHTTSKLSQVGSQPEEPSKGRSLVEATRSNLMSDEASQTSISDICSDDKASCDDSWASALISELEHFKNGKQRGSTSGQSIGASDINLMDDFVEMEKLALVTLDKPLWTCQTSISGADGAGGPLGTKGNETVLVSRSATGLNKLNQDTVPKEKPEGEQPDWLQDILEVVIEQTHITQKNPKEILEDVRLAMDNVCHLNARKVEYTTGDHPAELDIACISGNTNKYPSNVPELKHISNGVTGVDTSSTEKEDLSKSMSKVIELIEGISFPSSDYDNLETLSKNGGSFLPHTNSQTPTGYMVRVLQWKTSELHAVLEQFVHICYDILSGKADLNKFTQELSSALDWILNHCFSLQDVSSMKDAIKKHFDLEETRSECEAEVGIFSPFSEAEKLCVSLPISTALNQHSNLSQSEVLNRNTTDENRKLRDELSCAESAEKELEVRLHSAISETESLKSQLRESESSISRLQVEIGNIQKSSVMTQDQVESYKFMNEDLLTQLVAAKAELDEAREKLSSLQVELENKSNCCEELESKCLELQLQLESVAEKETQDYGQRQEEKQLRTDWEITAASEKLAECQETILNLGKQLKALAPPGEAVIIDKVICAPPNVPKTTCSGAILPASNLHRKKSTNRRSSLLDQMLAEDDAKAEALKSPNTKEILDAVRQPDDDAGTQSSVIVPTKKRSVGSLWKKLLWRKSKKKMNLHFPPQQVMHENKTK